MWDLVFLFTKINEWYYLIFLLSRKSENFGKKRKEKKCVFFFWPGGGGGGAGWYKLYKKFNKLYNDFWIIVSQNFNSYHR
jgi:hypothetical protein